MHLFSTPAARMSRIASKRGENHARACKVMHRRKERTTGFEPATFGLGSRRSTAATAGDLAGMRPECYLDRRSGSAMSPRYRMIVADPPWHYDKAGGYSWRRGRPSGDSRPMLGYGTMTVEEIAALPVGALAEDDAALFMWTTQRYLADTPVIVGAWGFAPVKLLTWVKSPTGFSVGGTFGNASEFIVYARRGRNIATERTNRDWWNWPRAAHSAKPDAFLDIVEQTHPGPYAELFARRARFGWDYPIGDQALGGVAA